MDKISKVIFGILVILVGVVLGTNALGITDINLFFNGWWAILFIVIPSLIGTFKGEKGALVGLIIGAILFLTCNNVLPWNIIGKLFIPTIVIAIGISLICEPKLKGKIGEKIRELNKSNPNLSEYAAVFSGEKILVDNKEFAGANLSAVFGGIDFDLTKAGLVSDQVINVTSVFGGTDILVPNDINVVVKSTSIFGGTDNKIKRDKIEGVPTLYINVTNMFGGTEIK